MQLALNGRQIHHPRGKMVGGSSAINSHALLYPSRENIDAWASPVLGNVGWDWKHLEPYFRKFQTVNPPGSSIKLEEDIDFSNETIPSSGPIQASYPLSTNQIRRAWIETFRNLDCLARGGPLSSDGVGALTITCAIDNSLRERSHAGIAYLQAASSRSNLYLLENALATRIIFEKDPDGVMLATGVEYTLGGEQYTAATRGQVLVCGGAFHSPQILELSGIGMRERLLALGIHCIYNNPNVGGKSPIYDGDRMLSQRRRESSRSHHEQYIR